MKNMFPTFYQYTEEDYKDIWDNCLFVVDANVLLNLYRYTEETQEELLDILTNLSNKLWIPHQVSLEYLSNRISVILEQTQAFDQITSFLNSSSQNVVKELRDKFKKFQERHPSIELDSITENITQYFNNLITETKNNKQNYPDLLQKDHILEKITALFEDKVGEPFTQDELNALFSEGQQRYDKEFPPGYKDLKSKKGLFKYYKDLTIKSEYGDLIVWKQIIKKSLDEKVPIVFITDDVKEDWWSIVKGRTIGPRNELINEFNYKTNNQKFVMYSTQKFMEYAAAFSKSKVNLQAIKEIESLSEANKNNEESIDNLNEWRNAYKNSKESSKLRHYKERKPFRDIINSFKEIPKELTIDNNLIDQLHAALFMNVRSENGVPLSVIKATVSNELQNIYKALHLYPETLSRFTDDCIESLVFYDRIETVLDDEGKIFYFVNQF
ncbi:PIN-like domain-containing protein [Priestia megaterium]|uniref:PIN-like domain-containing protein n=1 Tax=Priestia megaterium TaxID=1404 RepID=UPI0036D91F50